MGSHLGLLNNLATLQLVLGREAAQYRGGVSPSHQVNSGSNPGSTFWSALLFVCSYVTRGETEQNRKIY